MYDGKILVTKMGKLRSSIAEYVGTAIFLYVALFGVFRLACRPVDASTRGSGRQIGELSAQSAVSALIYSLVQPVARAIRKRKNEKRQKD